MRSRSLMNNVVDCNFGLMKLRLNIHGFITHLGYFLGMLASLAGCSHCLFLMLKAVLGLKKFKSESCSTCNCLMLKPDKLLTSLFMSLIHDCRMPCFSFCGYSWSCVVLREDLLVEGRCQDVVLIEVRHSGDLMGCTMQRSCCCWQPR